MYTVNTTFLKFRIRQLGKIVREIPVPYLLIIMILLGSGLGREGWEDSGQQHSSVAGLAKDVPQHQ